MTQMEVNHALHTLMRYGREQGLYAAADEYEVRHRLLAVLQLDAWPDDGEAQLVALGQIQPKYVAGTDAQDYLKSAIGAVFVQVLTDAGVYKRDAAGQAGFARFIEQLIQ